MVNVNFSLQTLSFDYCGPESAEAFTPSAPPLSQVTCPPHVR
ncbi:hypothetical protein ACFPRL_04750 [Pseudoclavibacter helvolus]